MYILSDFAYISCILRTKNWNKICWTRISNSTCFSELEFPNRWSVRNLDVVEKEHKKCTTSKVCLSNYNCMFMMIFHIWIQEYQNNASWNPFKLYKGIHLSDSTDGSVHLLTDATAVEDEKTVSNCMCVFSFIIEHSVKRVIMSSIFYRITDGKHSYKVIFKLILKLIRYFIAAVHAIVLFCVWSFMLLNLIKERGFLLF